MKIKSEILKFVEQNNLEFIEISIVDTPYFAARDMVIENLRDGDLVVAAGGDGIANTALDAAMESNRDVTFAVLPLGNVNDFASSINGRTSDTAKILHGSVMDFFPLNLKINNEHKLFAGQYISFGTTTVLVDWLNSPATRAARKKYRGNVARLMLYGARNIGKISRAIAATKLPPHLDYNSFGFFLGRTGKYFKLRRTSQLHGKPDKFLFHHDNFRGKMFSDAGKLTGWLINGIPGDVTNHKKIAFQTPLDFVCQVGGDNVLLQKVSEITCRRSEKSIRILVPKN